MLKKEKLPDQNHFVHHTNGDIAKLAADLLSSGYTLSKIFSKGGVHIATEDMKLRNIVPDTIVSYKRKILELALQDQSKKLKVAQDKKVETEEINNLQEKYMVLSNALVAISKDRGWVVLK